MWLFFSNGFLSIVAHRDKPNHLLVRSRNMKHLEALFPNSKHFTLDNSDYPHRAIISKKEVANVVTNYILAMSYDNFKNSISNYNFKKACNIIWSIMYQYGADKRGQLQ
tara:strand:+ start:395 stop:721 length:327 start_codon:yes stop_codon:yes gene_type:complete